MVLIVSSEFFLALKAATKKNPAGHVRMTNAWHGCINMKMRSAVTLTATYADDFAGALASLRLHLAGNQGWRA